MKMFQLTKSVIFMGKNGFYDTVIIVDNYFIINFCIPS